MAEKVIVPKMKTMGVLGGMGPQATIDFEQRVHRVAQQLVPQFVNRGYPPMVVAYHTDAPMVLREDGEVAEPLRADPKLLELARSIGPVVDFLVIPCNTAHFFVKEIEEAAGHEVLSIVDITIEEIKRRGLSQVILLAVGETLRRGLYQKRLEEIGVQYEVPPEDHISRLDEAIWKVMEGGSPERELDYLLQQIPNPFFRSREAAREVEGIIFGCTELPLAEYRMQMLGKLAINPNQLLAEAAVRYALKT